MSSLLYSHLQDQLVHLHQPCDWLYPNDSIVQEEASRIRPRRSQSCRSISRSKHVQRNVRPELYERIQFIEDDPLDVVMSSPSNSETSMTVKEALNLSKTLTDHAATNSEDSSSCSDFDIKIGQRSTRREKSVKKIDITSSPISPQKEVESCSVVGRSVTSRSRSVRELRRRTQPHERAYNDKQRIRVFREVVATERTYCSGLWTLIDVIAETFKRASFIPMKDLSVIFPSSLPALYTLHAALLNDLEQLESPSFYYRLDSPLQSGSTSTILLEAFRKNESELFSVYRAYLVQFTRAVRLIAKYMKHSYKFRRLVKKLRNHPSCASLDLPAFLVTPIQRLPRYLLLVKQLSNHTLEDQNEHRSLQILQLVLKSFLEEINSDLSCAMDTSAEERRERPQSTEGSCDSLTITDLDPSWNGSQRIMTSQSGDDLAGGKFTMLSKLLTRHRPTKYNITGEPSEHFLRHRGTSTHDTKEESSPTVCSSRVLLGQGWVSIPSLNGGGPVNSTSNCSPAETVRKRSRQPSPAAGKSTIEYRSTRQSRPQSVPPGRQKKATSSIVDSRTKGNLIRIRPETVLDRPLSVGQSSSSNSEVTSSRHSTPVNNGTTANEQVQPSKGLTIKKSFKKMFYKKKQPTSEMSPPTRRTALYRSHSSSRSSPNISEKSCGIFRDELKKL